MDLCACVLDREIGELKQQLNILQSKKTKNYDDYRYIWMLSDEIHYLMIEKRLLPVCAG